MAWATYTWLAGGNWWSQEATGTAAQSGQSSNAVGSVLTDVDGVAAVSQSQFASAVGASEISGAATSSGASQSSLLSGDLVTLGFIQTGGGQFALSVGVEEFVGGLSASQGQSSQALGNLLVDGSIQTVTSQAVAVTAAISIDGGATSAQSQTPAGVVALEIMGGSSTIQTPYIYALGEEEILGGGDSACSRQESFGSGEMEVEGSCTTSQSSTACLAEGSIEILGIIESYQMADTDSPEGTGEIVIAAWVRTAQQQDTTSYALSENYPKNTSLQSLLEYPHSSVFDKSPIPELAFRIRRADSLSWRVDRGVLFLSAQDGFGKAYPLDLFTINELVDKLVGDGVEVIEYSGALSDRSAITLINGSGNELESNGDRLTAYSSVLWALLSTFGSELDYVSFETAQALRQMIIGQAEGDWLDVWGTLYGDQRRANETDLAFSRRIPEEAFRLRVNALGIEKAILDTTGFDVRIQEPWNEIFRLDESTLSGSHRLYDGERTGYHLIQPTASSDVDWSAVLPVIERNKAAGVIVLAPYVRRITSVDASDGHYATGGFHSERSCLDRYQDRALLDFNLILDDDSDVVLNHPLRRMHEVLRSSYVEVAQEYAVTGINGRDYRVTYIDVEYRSQFWTDRRGWSSSGDTWDGFNAIIDSSHTRSP